MPRLEQYDRSLILVDVSPMELETLETLLRRAAIALPEHADLALRVANQLLDARMEDTVGDA